MRQKVLRGSGVLGLVLAFVLLPVFANAQQAGQGLEISPPLIDLAADPGQTIETEIRIRNVTDQTLVASAQYNDFTSGSEEDGQPKLLLGETDEQEESPYTIKDWLNSIPKVILEPQEQKVVKLTINVPEDASPGGHYGVIRFTGAPPEVNTNAVSLSASIGTLVLVTVSGDVTELANVAEIYTSHNGEKRSVFEYGPVTINTRIENSGNVHVQPVGKIVVSDWFGRTVQTFEFNESRGNVLPDSIRRFENTLQDKLLFGRYTIKADIVYGSDNTIVSSQSNFWAIPYKLVALAVGALILIYFGIKQYNRYIVKRAQKEVGDEPKKSKKNKK